MDKHRTYIMFAIVTLACAAGNLSQTAVNAMLGGIQASFGTTATVGQWLTTIYMLVIGITVPLVTHLARRYSMRTLTLASIVLSILGAVMAALSPNFWVLLAARVMQAVGCGITLPILQTIAMTRFPPGQNATAMGIAGIAMGFAPNIGPLVGGALVNTLGWQSFFWMFGAFQLILGVCTVLFVGKNEREMHDAHLDFLSFVLSTIGFGGILLGFSNASDGGFANVFVLAPIAVGALALVWFFMRQRTVEYPLISTDIFRSRTYVVSFVMQNLLFASFMGITLVLPLFVIDVCGLTAFDAGVVFIPTTILAIVFNPLAGILADKIGERVVIVCAALLLSAGAVSMAFMDASTPIWLMMTLQAIRGIGVSSLIGPLNSWGLSRLDHAVMVDGSAFFTTTRQACAAFGTALMMMLIALFAFDVVGFRMAFGLSALFAVCVLVGAVVAVRPYPSNSAQQESRH